MRQLYINIKPALKAFEITSKTVLGTELLGNYPSLFRGGGLEFAGFAKYTPMEDVRRIDWIASLRTRSLLMKEYVEERSLNVFFLIGSTASMLYTSKTQLKAEYAGELISSLAYIMMEENDLVGYVMFNKDIKSMAIPNCSMTQFYSLVKDISNKDYYSERCNLKKALDYAFDTLKPKTTLFIISDFINLTKGWEEALKRASTKYEIIGIMVRDPTDFVLPFSRTEEVMLRSPSSKRIRNVRLNPVREKYKEYVNKKTEYIKKVFRESNADILILITDKSFVSPVLNFFAMRKHKRWK